MARVLHNKGTQFCWKLMIFLIVLGCNAIVFNYIFTIKNNYNKSLSLQQHQLQDDDFSLQTKTTFLSHLNDLGLTFENVSTVSRPINKLYIECMGLSNTNDVIQNNIIRHKQNPFYYVNITSNTFQYIFSRNHYGMGIGNILAEYMAAKAMSFWLNYKFEWKECNNFHGSSQYNSTNWFSSFLPKKQENQLIHSDHAYFLYAKKNKHKTYYIHPSSLLFVFYNRFYRDIMSMELNNSLKAYYEFNKMNEKIELNNVFNNIEGDVVIHIRCGDVWTRFGRTPGHYGFLTTNYIKYSILNGTEKMLNINWMKDKLTRNTTIWILSQLSRKNNIGVRLKDNSAINDCSYLINYLVNYSFSNLFAPATVKIVYDSNINDDFYRMMNAPLLICSSSTFCLFAGIANKNGLVIIPRIGPWTDLNDIANHSRFLPSNHLVIDNKQNKWFVDSSLGWSSIGDYDIDNKQIKNITILAQYLVNH